MVTTFEEMFWNAQRAFDTAVMEKNLTSWLEIMASRGRVIKGLEQTEGLDLYKDYNKLKKRLIEIFYANNAAAGFDINDAQTQLDSLMMLDGLCYIYMEEVMRINKMMGHGDHKVGPNQASIALTVHAHVISTQTLLEELTGKATENADFRTLVANFINKVNIFTGKTFKDIGGMIDEYEGTRDRIFTKSKLTVIKKARNLWAHPEGEIEDQKKIDQGIKYMREILNKIK